MRIRPVTGYFNSFDWLGRHYQPRLPCRKSQTSGRRNPKRGAHDAYRTAMSMLDFYINRAGKNLSDSDRVALEKAKTALRKRFGRTDA